MRLILTTLALCLLPTLPALAQASPECRQVRPGMMICTRIDVEGRQHGPRSFYVLPRADMEWEARPLRRALRRGVPATVRRRPF